MKGSKPTLSEVGPYVFYENHHKTKLVWNENNTVTYQQIRFVSYWFNISYTIFCTKLSLYLIIECTYFQCLHLLISLVDLISIFFQIISWSKMNFIPLGHFQRLIFLKFLVDLIICWAAAFNHSSSS